jgi:hypothetical protein
LLSGETALDVAPGASMADMIKAIFDQPAVPLRQRIPDLPEKIAEIVDLALAKDPARRWQSAAAMRTALLHAT